MKRLVIIAIILLSSVAAAQINTERFRQDSDKIGLTGNISFSGTLMTGNVDFQLLSLGGRLNYNWGESYTFLVWDGGVGWTEGKTLLRQGLAHLRNVIKLNPWLQNEIFLQYDMNRKRLLLSRDLIGIGFRYKILTRKGFKLRAGTAYMYEREVYDLPQGSEHGERTNAHRFDGYVTLNIDFSTNLKLVSVNYYQPRLDVRKDAKFVSDNILVIKLGKLVDFNVLCNVRYDTEPPDGTKKLDTASEFGVTFKF